MRKCPICGIPLNPEWIYNQEIDRCAGCRGCFFDYGELGAIVRLIKLYRDVEIDEPDIETLSPIDRELHNCPADGGVMGREDFGGIPVDVCPDCDGVWLDKGELIHLKITERHMRLHLDLYKRLAQ